MRGSFLVLLLVLAAGLQVHGTKPASRRLQSMATCSADAPAGYVVYRLQCADKALIDTAGNFWYGGNSPILVNANAIRAQYPDKTILNRNGDKSQPQTVYQSECGFDHNTTLLLPVPGTGTYQVKMLNVEAYWTAPGKRIFSVSAGGIEVMTNVDLFAQAGNAALVATDNTFLASVIGTTLKLDFKIKQDRARFSGIVVTLVGPISPVFRLQCADAPLIDAAGNFWYGNKSPVLASSGVVNVQHIETIKTAGGADSVPQTVYKSECYFKTSTTLRLPVPRPGTYEVKLLNVEAWNGPPATVVGSRVFSVAAEGVVKLPNLDLYAQAGNKVFVQTDNTFLVDVYGDQTRANTLKLDLIALGTGEPRFSGIVVTPVCKPTPFEYRLQCSNAVSQDGWQKTWAIVDNTKFVVKQNSDAVLGLASDALQSIYQRECLPPNTDNMSVSIPVPRAAYYDVTVMQTEPWCDGITDTSGVGPCTRVFDIVAQGKTVVADLEIIARTPCRQMHYAYNSTFTVLVTTPELKLDFNRNPGSNNYPRFSAIYVKESTQNVLSQQATC